MVKRAVCGILLLVLGIALAGCGSVLPTLEPAPTAVPNTPEVAPYPTALLGTSVGKVYVRDADGNPTGYVLVEGQRVIVFDVDPDGWCWILPHHRAKVWCGCIQVGSDGCRER